jgi:hypothetical protein
MAMGQMGRRRDSVFLGYMEMRLQWPGRRRTAAGGVRGARADD